MVIVSSASYNSGYANGYSADNRFRYIFAVHKDETYGSGIYQNVRILDLKTLQTTYTANLPTANTTLASFDQVTISRTNNVYVTNVPISGYYISGNSTTPIAFSHETSHTNWKYNDCLAVFNVD